MAIASISASPGITAASAAPGSPGVPSDPAVIYAEDFENGSGVTLLPNYLSTSGATYTADSYWLNTHRCNGFVLSDSTPQPNLTQFCNNLAGNWLGVRAKASALGLLNTPQNPTTNRALSNNTAGAADNTTANVADGIIVPNNGIQFATENQLTLPSANRFVTFSVDAAANNCNMAQPLLRFYLRNDLGAEIPVSNSAINPCTDPRSLVTSTAGFPVSYGNFAADGSLLMTGASLGIVLRNEEPSSMGNDGAIDNLRVLDVTPQLDKSYGATLLKTGETTTLTFTVTNTSELAEKSGWSFTDALPAGMVVSAAGFLSTDCPAANVAAVAGSSSITATGDLNQGMVSCSISVPVTSGVPGTFTNGPSNLSLIGLDAPGVATVSFEAPAISLTKTAGTAEDLNGDGITDIGDKIPYTFVVENPGDVPLSGVLVADPKVGSVTCPAATLAAGERMTCTASYTVTAADAATGSVVNVATVSGTSPQSQEVTSEPSTVTTPLQTPSPAVTLRKTAQANKQGALAAGDVVDYTFLITNTGNVPLSNLAVTETEFTGTGKLGTIICPANDIAPGKQTTCTASYTLTKADADAGRVSNTATASGVGGLGGTVVSSASTATVTVETAQRKSQEMAKEAKESLARTGAAGVEQMGLAAAGVLMLLGAAVAGAVVLTRRRRNV